MTRAGCVFAAARHTPPISLQHLTDNAPIMVLAPHPDDESLGCGGLIAGCAAAGIRVGIVLLTDGGGSHPGSRRYPPPRLATLRAAELVQALERLGIGAEHLYRLGFPDSAAPIGGKGFDAAVQRISSLARQIGAARIFASWAGDPHCDHAAAALIADAVAMQNGMHHLAYPVWGRLHPRPAVMGPALCLDVSHWLPAKRRAVACHRSQLGRLIKDSPQAFHLPRSLLNACLTDREIFFHQRTAQ